MTLVVRQFSTWRRGVILEIAIIACVLCQPARAQFLEDFDEAGSSLGGTIFTDGFLAGGGTFRRESLTGVTGAPNTNPALAINQGGDLELRYFEQGSPAFTHSVLLTAPLPQNNLLDATIDAYLGFGVASGFGARNAGLILRATTVGDYWLADIGANEHLEGGANLHIRPVHNGIAVEGPTLAIPDFDPANQAYHLRFKASGEILTATLFRQDVEMGIVTETFIGSVVSLDGTPVAGRAGLYAFVRGDNSVLFDDMVITVPEPTTFGLFSGAAFAALLLRWRRQKKRDNVA